MLRLTIILLCILALPLRANIDETVQQCVARYGRPVGFSEANPNNPFGTVVFAAADYTLVVFLLDTKEVGARVSKKDNSAFTDSEMKTIMAADTGGSTWTSVASSDPTCLRWSRGDKATVLYDKDKHVMIFTSQKMSDAVHVAPHAADKPPPAPAPALTNMPPTAPAGN